MPIRFASEAWPRPGLAEPRSASIAGFGNTEPLSSREQKGKDFFFLWCGRSRSKARSLHEKKLFKKTSTWTKVVACSVANHQNQNTNHQKHKGKTQIPQPDLRLTIQKTAKQTAKGARAQQKQPQKICQGHSGKNPLCRN